MIRLALGWVGLANMALSRSGQNIWPSWLIQIYSIIDKVMEFGLQWLPYFFYFSIYFCRTLYRAWIWVLRRASLRWNEPPEPFEIGLQGVVARALVRQPSEDVPSGRRWKLPSCQQPRNTKIATFGKSHQISTEPLKLFKSPLLNRNEADLTSAKFSR